MAEKYGTIPPKFTKEWWAYFWEYYKWHSIIVAFILYLIISGIVSAFTNVNYDLNVILVTGVESKEENIEKLSEQLTQGIEEITGNKKKDVLIQPHTLSNQTQQTNAQYSYAELIKLEMELQAGDTDLFILNGDVAGAFIANEAAAECFDTVDKWAPDADKERLKGKDDKFYAVSIEGNTFLESCGIDTQNMYIMVRSLFSKYEDDSEKTAMHENTINAVRYILSQQ